MVDIEQLSSGDFKKDHWPKITEAAGRLSSLNLYFVEADETIVKGQYKIIHY